MPTKLKAQSAIARRLEQARTDEAVLREVLDFLQGPRSAEDSAFVGYLGSRLWRPAELRSVHPVALPRLSREQMQRAIAVILQGLARYLGGKPWTHTRPQTDVSVRREGLGNAVEHIGAVVASEDSVAAAQFIDDAFELTVRAGPAIRACQCGLLFVPGRRGQKYHNYECGQRGREQKHKAKLSPAQRSEERHRHYVRQVAARQKISVEDAEELITRRPRKRRR